MPTTILQSTPTATRKHEGGAGGLPPQTPQRGVIPQAGLVRKISFCVTKPLCETIDRSRTATPNPQQTKKHNPHLSQAHTLLTLSLFLTPLSSFAGVNASQTLVLQTGNVERARLNTNGLDTTRVSATYISTTLVQASGTPTANNHLATKLYVDTAIAAAGGGPKYMGATSTSYDGALGGSGVPGAPRGNARCNAQYAGSRMMRSDDIAVTDFTTPIAVKGWVHCSSFMGEHNAYRCNTFPTVTISGGGNCYGGVAQADWSLNTLQGSYKGMTLNGSHAATAETCDNSFPIHCVKD